MHEVLQYDYTLSYWFLGVLIHVGLGMTPLKASCRNLRQATGKTSREVLSGAQSWDWSTYSRFTFLSQSCLCYTYYKCKLLWSTKSPILLERRLSITPYDSHVLAAFGGYSQTPNCDQKQVHIEKTCERSRECLQSTTRLQYAGWYFAWMQFESLNSKQKCVMFLLIVWA